MRTLVDQIAHYVPHGPQRDVLTLLAREIDALKEAKMASQKVYASKPKSVGEQLKAAIGDSQIVKATNPRFSSEAEKKGNG